MPDDVTNMTQKPKTKLGYTSAKKPTMVDGRRDFFTYRDLGAKAPAAARCGPSSPRRRPA